MKTLQTSAIILALAALLAAPAYAQQGPVPAEATALEATQATEAAYGVFSCTGCTTNSWVWTRALEAWRYESGSEERVWIYTRSGYAGSYAYINTADARHKMFIDAAASAHYVGLFYEGSSAFSNVRLWYY